MEHLLQIISLSLFLVCAALSEIIAVTEFLFYSLIQPTLTDHLQHQVLVQQGCRFTGMGCLRVEVMEAAVQREYGLSSKEGEGVSGVEVCQGGRSNGLEVC